jgi:hypothetical protein
VRKDVRRFAWATTAVVGGLLVADLGAELEDALPKWQFFSAAFLMGLGVLTLQRWFEVRQAEWSPLERRGREPVVIGSRWVGEVPANRWTVRAALLSGDGLEHGFAIVGHPDGRMLEANWQKKGWRIEGGMTEHKADSAIYRRDGNFEPVRDPGWKLWAPRPGDHFTREETEEILLAFAERRPLPHMVETRPILRKTPKG